MLQAEKTWPNLLMEFTCAIATYAVFSMFSVPTFHLPMTRVKLDSSACLLCMKPAPCDACRRAQMWCCTSWQKMQSAVLPKLTCNGADRHQNAPSKKWECKDSPKHSLYCIEHHHSCMHKGAQRNTLTHSGQALRGQNRESTVALPVYSVQAKRKKKTSQQTPMTQLSLKRQERGIVAETVSVGSSDNCDNEWRTPVPLQTYLSKCGSTRQP